MRRNPIYVDEPVPEWVYRSELRPPETDEEPWSAVALPAKGWSANWLNDPKVWLFAALAYAAVVFVAMWRYINR